MTAQDATTRPDAVSVEGGDPAPRGLRRAPAASPTTDEDEYYSSPGLVALDRRGHWWGEFREDLARYSAHYDGSVLKPLLVEQALWAVLVYRFFSGVHRGSLPAPVRAAVGAVAVVAHKVMQMATGVSIDRRAEILPGLYVGHFGPTLIGPESTIGAGCNISHGVSIGISGRGEHRGIPVLGDRVYLGSHCTVAGRIILGDGCAVGANSLVTRDVAPGTTVVGVPAQATRSGGSAGMGMHMRARRR